VCMKKFKINIIEVDKGKVKRFTLLYNNDLDSLTHIIKNRLKGINSNAS